MPSIYLMPAQLRLGRPCLGLLVALCACTSSGLAPDQPPTEDTADVVMTTDAVVPVTFTEPPGTTAHEEEPILHLAMSVHLEGWNLQQDSLFDKVVGDIERAAALYDAYGAKITWESKELTLASLQRGDNTLVDLHGGLGEVGIHADLGYSSTTAQELIEGLQAMDQDLTELLGEPSQHISGICSDLDWVDAALEAGFRGVSGVVEYCLLSLAEVPAEVSDCASPADCHNGYPYTMPATLHPWRTSDGRHWTDHDPDGELIILPTATGLKCQAEKLVEDSPTNCVFEADDLDIFFAELDEALTMLDPTQLNTFKGTYSQGEALDLELQEEWLTRLAPYLEDGRVQWATVGELMDMVP